jgi:hypothetical protein
VLLYRLVSTSFPPLSYGINHGANVQLPHDLGSTVGESYHG